MYLYTCTHTYLHINTHSNTGNDCLSKGCCGVCVECLEPRPPSCDHEVGEPEGQSWPSKWEWHGIVVKNLNLSRHCWSIELTNFVSALLQNFLLSKIVNSQYHLSYLEVFFKKKNNSPILTDSLYVLKHKDITHHYKNSDFFFTSLYCLCPYFLPSHSQLMWICEVSILEVCILEKQMLPAPEERRIQGSSYCH